MLKENFIGYIEESIRKNWNFQALADYKGEAFNYGDVAFRLSNLHTFFREAGIKQGDKIAILGKNSTRWGIAYLSIVSYGAVVVPILPDFKPDDHQHILNHSESVMLFAEESIFRPLDATAFPAIRSVINITDFSLLSTQDETIYSLHRNCFANEKIPAGFSPENFSLPAIPNNQLAVISYTSGPLGNVKGVMLEHNSLAANIRYAHRNMPLNAGDRIVSFLPLAHTFGCAFEFLFPFTLGCNITILTKTPSPQIIIAAFQEVKPSLILSVPLVIEKIFKKQVLPVIRKWHMKLLLAIPGLNTILLKKINQKLTHVFGENFREIVVGGAPFNHEAETFFRRIRFPFTVGYGMTECGPLISYIKWTESLPGSSGKVVDTLEMKIASSDPANIAGEILVRGENVMRGYFKNEKATADVLDEDGWLHTGDLGLMDKEGNLFIKGRSKSMILGANGRNIYPEEIESAIDNMYAVGESLIVQREEKLVALIYPDPEIMEKEKISMEEVRKLFDQHIKTLNQRLPLYMNIAQAVIQDKEFVKTPKRSIKRYLYQGK